MQPCASKEFGADECLIAETEGAGIFRVPMNLAWTPNVEPLNGCMLCLGSRSSVCILYSYTYHAHVHMMGLLVFENSPVCMHLLSSATHTGQNVACWFRCTPGSNPLIFFHCYRMCVPWITLLAEQELLAGAVSWTGLNNICWLCLLPLYTFISKCEVLCTICWLRNRLQSLYVEHAIAMLMPVTIHFLIPACIKLCGLFIPFALLEHRNWCKP